MRALPTILLLLFSACVQTPETGVETSVRDTGRTGVDDPQPADPTEPRDLPDGWRTVPPHVFESWVAEWETAGSNAAYTDAAYADLALALDAMDATSVRAALFLAHGGEDRASEILIERLERREPAPARELDAGDAVAAAALAHRRLPGGRLSHRLEQLAIGPEPHPDVEVRVEIARSALTRGRDTVIPFLLRVMRSLTPAELDDPPDWERKTTMAWAKYRASEALAERAGVENGFRPDGPWQDQLDEIERLEAHLAGDR